MQVQRMTIDELRCLLIVMEKSGKDATIDWVNRTIKVLSEVKINPKIQLSTGPLTYQDILYRVKFINQE